MLVGVKMFFLGVCVELFTYLFLVPDRYMVQLLKTTSLPQTYVLHRFSRSISHY